MAERLHLPKGSVVNRDTVTRLLQTSPIADEEWGMDEDREFNIFKSTGQGPNAGRGGLVERDWGRPPASR